MSLLIASSDIAELCLILCDYDINASLQTIVDEMCRLQLENNVYFASSEYEFEVALFHLAVGLGKCSYSDYIDISSALSGISLKDCLAPMLEYDSLYVNDEGCHWWPEDDSPENLAYNQPFREFFSTPSNRSPHNLACFFEQKNRSHLYQLLDAINDGRRIRE